MKRRNFIEREVFDEIIGEVRRADGRNYEDIDTIYGDMSRLVVAWLSKTSPEDLRELYNQFSWGGTANARAFHECAKVWMAKYRPSNEASASNL